MYVYNIDMSSITIEIPEVKKSQYEVILRALVKEYSPEDIEDFMLGLHMSKNDSNTYPIAKIRDKYASQIS